MSVSKFSEEDEILGDFVRELSRASDNSAQQRIVLRFVTKYPHLQNRIQKLAVMEKVLEQSRQSGDIPGMPHELGEFLIIRRIGNEGMGEIYESYHERLDRRVAIKIIRRGRASDEANQRFSREQLVLAKLHQTHIVPIHTAGEHNGVQYFVMPYIEGASLNFVVQAAREYHSTESGRSTPSVGRFAEVAVSRMKAGGTKTQGDFASRKATPFSRELEPTSTKNLVEPIRFWKEYHSSVARAIADAAEAVSYAHAAGVLHRDIKPHNIMIEPNGHVWVIDFGLAGFHERKSDNDSAADGVSDGVETVQSFDEDPQLTQGMGGGTPSYLAPERWEGSKASEQSEVWALGATLYELLTLHRAFAGPSWKVIRDQILEHPPRAPKELVAGLPGDLAAICRKAMERDPTRRYQTAIDLAADLRRWLNHEPTTALPARAPRRAVLWCRRNPGWASLIGAMVLMISLLVGVEARAVAKQQAEERQLGLRQLERIQATTHPTGWSQMIWEMGQKLPALEGESDLRDALATSLIDIDAEVMPDDRESQADFLAFDETGEWLVSGGSTDSSGKLFQLPKVLDLKTQTWRKSAINGSGPVAFRKDKVPVILVPDPGNASRVKLYNVTTSEELMSFDAGGLAEKLEIDNRRILILSPDAAFVAAATPYADGSETETTSLDVHVWNTTTSEQIHHCRVSGVSSLAVTPDGTRLSIGRTNGKIELWNVGQTMKAAEFQDSRSAVLSLSFGRDYLRRESAEPGAVAENGWLLASGDAAGGVVVWDVGLRKPRTVLLGAAYETLGLKFSDDSTLLFSVGRPPARIWDVATGEQVLTWATGSYMTAIAVSNSGLFASSNSGAFGFTPGILIQKLLKHRGGTVFRGLRDIPRRLTVSPDGSLIAALTMTWQVGVWNIDGSLLHVFEAPVGPFADNATIAFHPNNREIFCCTGDRALTWDLTNGAVSQSWKVSPGFVNEAAYSPNGQQLFLVRKELVDGSRYPSGNLPPDRFSSIFRAFDLLSNGGSTKPILELKGFAEKTYRAQVGGNGLLILAGHELSGDGKRTSLREGWDLLTNKRLWSEPYEYSQSSFLELSHQGTRLLRSTNRAVSLPEIVDPRSGVVLTAEQRVDCCDDRGLFSVAMSKAILNSNDDDRYAVLFRSGEPDPLVSFFFEAAAGYEPELFEHRNRTHLAWANANGHVVAVDLEQVQSELKSVGLGW